MGCNRDIPALAAHVPTIRVAYSCKAHGMGRYVYGPEDWVMEVSQMCDSKLLVDKVRLMGGERDSIRDHLRQRIGEMQRLAFNAARRIGGAVAAAREPREAGEI